MYFSFSIIFNFRAILQVLQCSCIISHIYQYSRHNPGPTVCISHFSLIWVFLAIFHDLQCVFLILHYFQFSCHIPGSTVCISHFSRFWVFLAIFQVLQCSCLIFHIFQFSRRNLNLHIQCVYLVFYVFQCFLPYFTSYCVCFSFSMIFSFIAILQVLQYAFLIFHVFQSFCQITGPTVFVSQFRHFQFPRHTPGPTVCISHFPRFWVFLAIIHVIYCAFLIFHLFQCFSPYSRSNSVCVSFRRVSVSPLIPCHNMCISHFSYFWVFLDIFQVIKCVFLILHAFPFSRHTPGTTLCISPFPPL